MAEWWRTDEPPDLPQDPTLLQKQQQKDKRPDYREVLKRVQNGSASADIVAQDVCDDFVVAICRVMCGSSLIKKVYFGANVFSRRAWRAITGTVAHHQTIERWSLPKVHIGKKNILPLAIAIGNSAAYSFDFAESTGIRTQGGYLLLAAVEKNSRITCCYLGGSDVPSELASRIQSTAALRRKN